MIRAVYYATMLYCCRHFLLIRLFTRFDDYLFDDAAATPLRCYAAIARWPCRRIDALFR